MAKEKEEKKGEEKDKKFMLLLILQGITLIALAGMGVLLFLNSQKASAPVKMTQSTQAKPEIKKEIKEVKKEEEVTCTLDPFIVNLMDEGGRRYLRVKMDLVLSSKNAEDEIKKKTAEIRDAIIMTLSGKRFNDIATFEGKARLRNELKENINKILACGKILNIYFTEFVIQ
ncbi:MAG: hypothetical protein DRG39_00540 [Deltaproteobacteria bacterium]|nr:MAG: hypothetical protein DRG39_00540 [Deltaproteobacteria bacterium]